MNDFPVNATTVTTRRYQAYERVVADLLGQRESHGHWVGELSTSALSTATAVSALSTVLRRFASRDTPQDSAFDARKLERYRELQRGGVDWLVRHQNADGGWGDTELSYSNISTSMLVRAAFQLAGVSDTYAAALERVDRYIQQQGGVEGLRRRYGKDKTFAVPILANCAIAGQVEWREVSPLPFEAAWVPQRFYRWMQLPVVSYAIPALVAIGQARFHHCPPKNPITRGLRRSAIEPTLRVLLRMQPASGGYLEAIPLTSFVVMGLASTDRCEHPVVQAGLKFIDTSVRDDGSWPIDTNLATWNTTLSVNALLSSPSLATDAHDQGSDVSVTPAEQRLSDPVEPSRVINDALTDPRLHEWILSCQHTEVHPFTGAQPGGWGWTDLSGAVPDADDTPGAMLALRELDRHAMLADDLRPRLEEAIRMGARWLLDLQNRDGGWPTFCRGWGKLPFDRSGADLTAHAMRALQAWLPMLSQDARLKPRLERACQRGLRYLERVQNADGSWLPLWFGNQDQPDDENPVYGTAKVLFALRDLGKLETEMARRGLDWLKRRQNADGGWGGGPSWGYSQAGEFRAVSGRRSPEEASLPLGDAVDPGAMSAGTGGSPMPTRAVQASSRDKQQTINDVKNPGNDVKNPGGSSVEESALAIEAWLAFLPPVDPGVAAAQRDDLERGIDWLTQAIEAGWHHWQSPIGFYFAKLWYHERLYPLVFAAAAMAQVVRRETGAAGDERFDRQRSPSAVDEQRNSRNSPAATSVVPRH